MALGMAERETTAAPAPVGGHARRRPNAPVGHTSGASTSFSSPITARVTAWHASRSSSSSCRSCVRWFPLCRARRAARRSRPGGRRRADQGGRPVRRVPRRRVHELRRADDRRRDPTALPLQGVGDARPTEDQGVKRPPFTRARRSHHDVGRSPTIAGLAQAAAVDEENVIDALDAAHAYSTRSLDAAAGGRAARGSPALRLRGSRRPVASPRRPRSPRHPRTAHRRFSLLRGDDAVPDRGRARGSRRCTSRGSCGTRST